MANKKISVTVSHSLEIPTNVKVITNNEWVTLAKKKGNVIQILTMEAEHIRTEDILDENSWLDLTKEELNKLAAL
jgi:hypothetical protein